MKFLTLSFCMAASMLAADDALPNLLTFHAIGEGTITSSGTPGCQFGGAGNPNAICTIGSQGIVKGEPIGKAHFTSSLSIEYDTYPFHRNGRGGGCAQASGTVTLTTEDGSTIHMQQVGQLCEVAATGASPHTFNGTYYIDGGTGRFAGATGSGNNTASDSSAVSVAGKTTVLTHLDGNIKLRSNGEKDGNDQ